MSLKSFFQFSILAASVATSLSTYAAGQCDADMLNKADPGIQVYAQKVLGIHENSLGEILIISEADHSENIGVRPGSTPIDYVSFKIGKRISPDEKIGVIGKSGMNEFRNAISELTGNRELQEETAHQRFAAIMKLVVSDTITLNQARYGAPVYQMIQEQRARLMKDSQGRTMLMLEEIKHRDQVTQEQVDEIIRAFESRAKPVAPKRDRSDDIIG